MRTIKLTNFGIQPLPPGYHVEWWEQDEHYHWVCGERYGDICATRWQALSDAWIDYRSTEMA